MDLEAGQGVATAARHRDPQSVAHPRDTERPVDRVRRGLVGALVDACNGPATVGVIQLARPDGAAAHGDLPWPEWEVDRGGDLVRLRVDPAHRAALVVRRPYRALADDDIFDAHS